MAPEHWESGLQTDMRHQFVAKRKLDVEVKTTAGNPVRGVEVVVEFENGDRLMAVTDDSGFARIEEAPPRNEGTTAFVNEEDALLRSFAADLQAALEGNDERYVFQFLQSAIDFKKTDQIYQANYGASIADAILGVFSGDDSGLIVCLLIQNELTLDRSVEPYWD